MYYHNANSNFGWIFASFGSRIRFEFEFLFRNSNLANFPVIFKIRIRRIFANSNTNSNWANFSPPLLPNERSDFPTNRWHPRTCSGITTITPRLCFRSCLMRDNFAYRLSAVMENPWNLSSPRVSRTQARKCWHFQLEICPYPEILQRKLNKKGVSNIICTMTLLIRLSCA
jgi:hypothetical protein